MSNADLNQQDAYRCACPGCGSAMQYDIPTMQMVCGSCGQSLSLDDLNDEESQTDDDMLDVVEYTCPSCGATLNASQGGTTSHCCYCGSDVVLTARLSRIKRPMKIMPFRITREECESIYRQHIQKYRYAPDELKSQETIGHFRPVYIPFWHYSFTAKGPTAIMGQRHYHDSNYLYTDYYHDDLTGEINVSGVPYDASSAFDDETAQLLDFKYNANESRPFHPAYLCGLYAGTPDASDVIFRQEIQAYASAAFDDACCLKTGLNGRGSLPRDRSMETSLVLLPVWILASRQGERVLYTAVNGLNGTIVCDPPVSKKRYLRLAAMLFAAVLALLLIASFTDLIILRPNILLGLTGLLSALGMRWIVKRADKTLIHSAVDMDPTRRMKRLSPEKDVALTTAVSFQENQAGISSFSNHVENRKRIVDTAVWAAVLLISLFFLSIFHGSDGILNALISDDGVFVPFVLIAALILLITKHYTYRKVIMDEKNQPADIGDVIILYAMRLLVFTSIVVTLVSAIPGYAFWCYGLCLAIIVLFLYNMLRLNRLYRDYVTRPVPLFGKE